MEIVFFNGEASPVLKFIQKLSPEEKARVLACLKSIESLGLQSPRVAFRQIRDKLWEIKIKTKRTGYRIFYVSLHRDLLVLLHAYQKQSQKAPQKEIDLAEKRMMEVIKNEKIYLK